MHYLYLYFFSNFHTECAHPKQQPFINNSREEQFVLLYDAIFAKMATLAGLLARAVEKGSVFTPPSSPHNNSSTAETGSGFVSSFVSASGAASDPVQLLSPLPRSLPANKESPPHLRHTPSPDPTFAVLLRSLSPPRLPQPEQALPLSPAVGHTPSRRALAAPAGLVPPGSSPLGGHVPVARAPALLGPVLAMAPRPASPRRSFSPPRPPSPTRACLVLPLPAATGAPLIPQTAGAPLLCAADATAVRSAAPCLVYHSSRLPPCVQADDFFERHSGLICPPGSERQFSQAICALHDLPSFLSPSDPPIPYSPRSPASRASASLTSPPPVPVPDSPARPAFQLVAEATAEAAFSAAQRARTSACRAKICAAEANVAASPVRAASPLRAAATAALKTSETGASPVGSPPASVGEGDYEGTSKTYPTATSGSETERQRDQAHAQDQARVCTEETEAAPEGSCSTESAGGNADAREATGERSGAGSGTREEAVEVAEMAEGGGGSDGEAVVDVEDACASEVADATVEGASQAGGAPAGPSCSSAGPAPPASVPEPVSHAPADGDSGDDKAGASASASAGASVAEDGRDRRSSGDEEEASCGSGGDNDGGNGDSVAPAPAAGEGESDGDDVGHICNPPQKVRRASVSSQSANAPPPAPVVPAPSEPPAAPAAATTAAREFTARWTPISSAAATTTAAATVITTGTTTSASAPAAPPAASPPAAPRRMGEPPAAVVVAASSSGGVIARFFSDPAASPTSPGLFRSARGGAGSRPPSPNRPTRLPHNTALTSSPSVALLAATWSPRSPATAALSSPPRSPPTVSPPLTLGSRVAVASATAAAAAAAAAAVASTLAAAAAARSSPALSRSRTAAPVSPASPAMAALTLSDPASRRLSPPRPSPTTAAVSVLETNYPTDERALLSSASPSTGAALSPTGSPLSPESLLSASAVGARSLLRAHSPRGSRRGTGVGESAGIEGLAAATAWRALAAMSSPLPPASVAAALSPAGSPVGATSGPCAQAWVQRAVAHPTWSHEADRCHRCLPAPSSSSPSLLGRAAPLTPSRIRAPSWYSPSIALARARLDTSAATAVPAPAPAALAALASPPRSPAARAPPALLLRSTSPQRTGAREHYTGTITVPAGTAPARTPSPTPQRPLASKSAAGRGLY